MAKPLMQVHADGLKPILKRLQRLPERNRRHAIRPAVRKASTPVRKVAKRLAPKGTAVDDNRPPLRKTITKTSVKWQRPTDTFYVVVGPEAGKAPHAHLVHDGTRPHEIILTQPLILGGTFLPAGFVIQHPGSRANPFIARAAEATRSQVQSILRKSILENIDKQVAKLAASR